MKALLMGDDMRAVKWMLLAVPVLMGQATRPLGHFTVGKETTYITEPLNADGTPDYLEAWNRSVLSRVRAEENAMPLMLAMFPDQVPEADRKAVMKRLGVERLPPAAVMATLESYLKAQAGAGADADKLVEEQAQHEMTRQRPWEGEEFPKAEQWLKESEGVFKSIEEMCAKPHSFYPYVAEKKPAWMVMAMPKLLTAGRTLADALLTRAMYRAGKHDSRGALEDLRRVRQLAKHAVEGQTALNLLLGALIEHRALTAYSSLLLASDLTADQCKTIRGELARFTFSESGPWDIERYLLLDTIMQCIKGNVEEVLKAYAGAAGTDQTIDLGDLRTVNWDLVMREVNHQFAPMPQQPFAEVLKRLDEKVRDAEEAGMPVIDLPDERPIETRKRIVEAYLKRRAGESAEGYARRIAEFLAGGPKLSRSFTTLCHKPHVFHAALMVTVELHEYWFVHGHFPSTLDGLKSSVTDDYADAPFHYVPMAGNVGFVLYGVGINRKDDMGTGDDLAITVNRSGIGP